MNLVSDPVVRNSSPQAKIALFRSLFRGRDDVYPRRFESRKTGKSGYAPACANEWVRGICEKPRIKCAECPHRRFLPLTDEIIRWHLSGSDSGGESFVAGVYPLLQDEACFSTRSFQGELRPEQRTAADAMLGRLHRLFDSKREVRIYDYADLNVPMLARRSPRLSRPRAARDTNRDPEYAPRPSPAAGRPPARAPSSAT